MNTRQLAVGFLAPSQIMIMGPASDIKTFFKATTQLLENGVPCSKYPLVVNRLYCGALTQEELSVVLNEMKEIEKEFSVMNTSQVNLKELGVDPNHTKLDLTAQTLAGVFRRFFSNFARTVEWVDISMKEGLLKTTTN